MGFQIGFTRPGKRLYNELERSTILNGKTHDKWPCSIAMLVYQRVREKVHQPGNPQKNHGKIYGKSGGPLPANPLPDSGVCRYDSFAMTIAHLANKANPI